MRKTKKLTVSAAATALGILFMAIGANFAPLDLSCSVLASMLVAFVYFEIGSPYTWLVWLGTALLSFIFFTSSFVWLSYLLMFGVYPILKGYIGKAPRVLQLPLKLVFVNAVVAVMFFFGELLTTQSLFGDPADIPLDSRIVYAALWLLLDVAFLLYDRLLVLLSVYYSERIRPKIANLLK